MYSSIFLFFASVFSLMSPLLEEPLQNTAVENKEQSLSDYLRIQSLLPGLERPIAIRPAIPDNFVALAKGNEAPKVSDWIYWGPKDVVEAYLRDPDTLQEPIIRVRLSIGTRQTGPDSFLGEEHLANMGYERYQQTKFRWGRYPVLGIRFYAEGRMVFLALAGINSPDGQALLFELIYPLRVGHPDGRDLGLWGRFLTETKSFSPPNGSSTTLR